MIRLRLKASQNLISPVENTGTGENLPVGEKSKVRALLTVALLIDLCNSLVFLFQCSG